MARTTTLIVVFASCCVLAARQASGHDLKTRQGNPPKQLSHTHFDQAGHITTANSTPGKHPNKPNVCKTAGGRKPMDAEAKKRFKDQIHEDFENEFNEGKIRQIGFPSALFNCHDYATVVSTEPVMVGDVETLFTTDYEIQSGAPQVCNVIVYFKHQTPDPNNINWNDASHSAHVTEVTDGKITKVKSKWGEGPIYEHDPGVVPERYRDGNTAAAPYLVFKKKP